MNLTDSQIEENQGRLLNLAYCSLRKGVTKALVQLNRKYIAQLLICNTV